MPESLEQFAYRAALTLAVEALPGSGFRATLSPCALEGATFPPLSVGSYDTLRGPKAESAAAARQALAVALRGSRVTSFPSQPRNMYSFDAPADLEG